MSSESASKPMTERENIMLGIIVVLAVILLNVCVWYWNTGDDYDNGYRVGYCTAQGAEFEAPNLCMNGDKVVSVWTE